jgi:hypothetical protein
MSEVRYEPTDVRVGGVFAFAVGLLLFGAGIIVAVAWMFDVFHERAQSHDAPTSVMAARQRLRLPRDVDRIPPPVLQQDEVGDLERLRAAEEDRLNGSGWVDSKGGVVRIPVAEAMRRFADPDFAKGHGIRIDAAKKKGGG